MALVIEDAEFQHILRILNTNVDGRERVAIALTKIKGPKYLIISFMTINLLGIGRRFSNLICKKANIDLAKRAGELNEDEIEVSPLHNLHSEQFVLDLEGHHRFPTPVQHS